MTVTFHRRWLTRLFFPLCFAVYVAVWVTGSAVVTTSTVLIGIAAIVVAGGLSVAVWCGRLVVEPDVVRLRSLFGWRTAIRFDDLDGQAGRDPHDCMLVVDSTGVLRDAMTTAVAR